MHLQAQHRVEGGDRLLVRDDVPRFSVPIPEPRRGPVGVEGFNPVAVGHATTVHSGILIQK